MTVSSQPQNLVVKIGPSWIIFPCFLFLKKTSHIKVFQYRKRCDELPSVDLASPIIINEEFPIGSVVSYKCVNQTSQLTGDPTIVCDENGKWSDIQFTCDRISVTKLNFFIFFNRTWRVQLNKVFANAQWIFKILSSLLK